ncbi:pentapeptide repeat-containing protein [Cronbergia sp. UHCC 0137]|uniref:pentapeptide repeat-containing protein n=1 Tax=Cronbergia sp. UHCC 0137 TaxID=3110239 RepID=UPI002B215EB3|nr:pentapeptide repeat-containing protein [Cronbergia sp. UHCC 0137]MEA5621164.1 pentapeptide repeat-containing protein [Cronbergia sp. UHCC 0137]
MSDNNTESFKNLLIILGIIFFIILIAIVLIFSFSDFAFLYPKGLKIEQRLQYGIPAVTTTGTIFAGIAVFFNAYQASRSANAANENAKAANKNAQAAEDKQITERFSKAIELLGNQQIEVKLGGIYALEQIAKDSPEKYHWTIMEVLTAFVRENAPLKKEEEAEKEEIPKLRIDIQAALTVIGRRNCENEQENQRLDLSKIDIRGANLYKANLEGANFTLSNLQGVSLFEADLQKALLFGIKLQNAYLNNANFQDVDIAKANLQEADLSNANLQGADLNKANLQDVVLYRANLQGANLNKANLQDAFLGEANLQEANFNQANLKGANLERSKNIQNQQIILANGDEYTILPDFINKPMNW